VTTRMLLGVGCAGMLLSGAAATAPLRPPGTGQTQRPTFSTQSELVVLNVTVTDKYGSYLSGLDRGAFTLFDDDQPQTIEVFSAVDTPVTVGLVIDDSASMFGTRALIAAAAETFAATSHPADEIFALTFNDVVRRVLPADAPFAGSPEALRAAVAGRITTRGRTALHDAVLEGVAYAAGGRHSRRVLVIVSDGDDTASATDFEQVLRSIQASSTVIYTVAVRDQSGAGGRPDRLKTLASATGGQAFRPGSVNGIAEALRAVARDIRHAYTLGYAPAPGTRIGGYHRLRVTARNVDGDPCRVRTRQGYTDDGG
jgi:Ca-activated chloride channel homolog